jgi:hypothetical protein
MEAVAEAVAAAPFRDAVRSGIREPREPSEPLQQ